MFVLCDGDLAESAARLAPLARAVQAGEADLAVAAFARRVGGGVGLALGFARWAIRRRCGAVTRAPISGQRALGEDALRAALPFAAGFGMEIGMTIDVLRAGHRLVEVELDLAHRASGRTLGGFLAPRPPAPRLRARVCGAAQASRRRDLGQATAHTAVGVTLPAVGGSGHR